MSVNIYDTANQMEEEIRKTDEYQELKKAFKAVQNDEEANKMYKEFQGIQSTLQKKQMNGESLSDDEMKKFHDVANKIEEVDLIKELMDKERRLNQLFSDINQIIIKPIQDLYNN